MFLMYRAFCVYSLSLLSFIPNLASPLSLSPSLPPSLPPSLTLICQANNQSLEGNSAGESSHSSTPSPSSPPSPSPSSPSSSSSPSSNHSSAADDLVGDEGVREAGLEGRKGEQAESTDLDSDTSNDLLEYTSGEPYRGVE